MVFLSQGAEAVVELIDDKVYKKRIVKSYRHPELDTQLRISRSNRERKVMGKAKDLGMRVPELFRNDDKTTIVMEYIKGVRLRDTLLKNPDRKDLLVEVGKWLGTFHINKIIHGDLTTSNVMYSDDGELVMIDFGLSFFSTRIEDMAVDIHLLRQAIMSTHYLHEKEFFEKFREGYVITNPDAAVFERLEIVEKRGRNKH